MVSLYICPEGLFISPANQMPPETEAGKRSLERLKAIQEETGAVKKKVR
jgi:hypothetical protein